MSLSAVEKSFVKTIIGNDVLEKGYFSGKLNTKARRELIRIPDSPEARRLEVGTVGQIASQTIGKVLRILA